MPVTTHYAPRSNAKLTKLTPNNLKTLCPIILPTKPGPTSPFPQPENRDTPHPSNVINPHPTPPMLTLLHYANQLLTHKTQQTDHSPMALLDEDEDETTTIIKTALNCL